MTGAVRLSLGLLVLAASAHFFSVPVADNDLWGHVRFGQRMLDEARLPDRNDYSYTEPDHPWINHETVAELALASAWDVFGSAGLLGLKWLCGLATLAILGATTRRRGVGRLETVAVLVLAASLMAWGFHARPQIFTFLFLAVLWDWIDRAGWSPATLLAAPGLIALWANTHGGVLAGLGILGVAGAGLVLATPDARSRALLAGVALASLLALLANPYGWHLPAFLLHDVTLDRPISEWAAIPLLDASNPQFKLAALAACLGFLVPALRRERPWEAVVILAAIVGTFRHERHLPLFAIVATPHLGGVLARALRAVGFDSIALEQRDRLAQIAIASGALALAVVLGLPSLRTHAELGLEIEVPRADYPVEAVALLARSGLDGNLAVPFGWGEYAIWHLHPRFRVSVDGRYTTAYSLGALDAGWRYLDGGEGWDRHLERADVALADTRHATAARLANRPGWRRIHADTTASLFVRESLAARLDGVPPAIAAGRSVFP